MSSIEIIAGIVTATLSAFLGYLGLRRGTHNDETAQENIANTQVYAGYGGLLTRIQEDNADLRRRNAELEQRNTELERRQRQ